MSELSEYLANFKCNGYILAPAGHGKTYLIAESVVKSTRRKLILTHTYAGVNALQRKLKILQVNRQSYHVTTIASWALRLSLAYSHTSQWNEKNPSTNSQWKSVYDSCATLLDHQFCKRIVQASYEQVYVDEYQDCSKSQHKIVLKLAQYLPTVILGDPLQGIFDFGEERQIDWIVDVEANFDRVGELNTPYRWRNSDTASLGSWLKSVRDCLENEGEIYLDRGLPSTVKFVPTDDVQLIRTQQNTCRYFNCERDHSVIAIHNGTQKYKAKCHRLSNNLSGRYSSIEEVEGKDLFSFVNSIDAEHSSRERLRSTVQFAKKCMTAVTENLTEGTKRGELVKIRNNTRNPETTKKANAFVSEPSSENMLAFFRAMKNIATVKVFRADLFFRLFGVLRTHIAHPNESLTEAAERFHTTFRHMGRLTPRRRLIGTTLLVKGLEFDHAIVLDATSLKKKELYVALTRASRSLTIIATKPVLNPID